MKKIVKPLLQWYEENKRILPWRIDKDPYHVWISEIMLQQTRIETVKSYYERFMKRLPTLSDLSEIEEDELLKLWEGLGYYKRAQNLKKSAIVIMRDYGGKFPNIYEEIIKLPGIGAYTAGAICSICFSLKQVAVDGNVMRVYARVCNLDIDILDNKEKKKVGEKLKDVLPNNSGDFNEAIMELGETVCLSNTSPKCEICPLSEYCLANKSHRQNIIPRKMKKKVKKIEQLMVLLFICDKKIAIQKRDKQEFLKNMWEFPNVEGNRSIDEVVKNLGISSIDIVSLEKGIEVTTIFTHKKWNMQSYVIFLTNYCEEYTWVSLEEIRTNYAIPTAFKSFVEDLEKRLL